VLFINSLTNNRKLQQSVMSKMVRLLFQQW